MRYAAGVSDARAGAMQSLMSAALRRQLDDVGRQVGTPVVYLKAAWADPVLYGGRGERCGVDVDVLVDPRQFESFARVLEERRFRRYRHPSPTFDRYYRDKEWTFYPERGALSVDLHCALGDPHWFELPTDAVLARATTYDGASGPILSLSPEDHVLYAALHYANHIYQIDDRHLQDVVRLIAARTIVWADVMERARDGGMRLPLLLLLETLRFNGAAVPETLSPSPGRALRARRALCRRWVVTTPALGRRRASPDLLEYLVLRPLLSDRPSALPRVIKEFMLPLLRERLTAPTEQGSMWGGRA